MDPAVVEEAIGDENPATAKSDRGRNSGVEAATSLSGAEIYRNKRTRSHKCDTASGSYFHTQIKKS